jgi:hypothetical protein
MNRIEMSRQSVVEMGYLWKKNNGRMQIIGTSLLLMALLMYDTGLAVFVAMTLLVAALVVMVTLLLGGGGATLCGER